MCERRKRWVWKMLGIFVFGKIPGIMACQTILKEIRIWAVMLVVSVALVNCTFDETILEESQEPEYTMTVEASMGGNPQTKALGFKDEKLVATWTENDVIYVFKETNFLGFLRPAEISTDGASCKLAGKMKVAPSIGDELTLNTSHRTAILLRTARWPISPRTVTTRWPRSR